MKDRIVIKLSGNLFEKDYVGYLKDIVGMYKELSKDYDIHFVVGGGKTARNYIEIGEKLGFNNYLLDVVGMNVARINALLLSFYIGLDNVYFTIPRSSEELLTACSSNKTIVMAGLQPGQSTMTVASLLAEALGSGKLIYLTKYYGLYEEDPEKNLNARLIKEIELSRAEQYLRTNSLPGGYELLDKHAQDILLRSSIYVYITSFKDPKEIKNIIENKEFKGTKVIPR